MVPRTRGDGTGDEQVNAFHVGSSYLFRHYFDGDAVFARLRRYYDRQRYRFAVPTREFDAIVRFLGDRGYALEPVTALDDFVVIVPKYTSHPEAVFEAAVLRRSHGEHTLFLLRDLRAVERAVADGATRLRDSPLAVTLGGQMRLPTANG